MWWLFPVLYFCATVLAVFSYIQWTRRKLYKTLATMSCPKTLPIIGHGHRFLNLTPESIVDKLKYFAEFPSPVCVHLGPSPQVAIFDPDQARVVLNSQNCLDKSLQYSFLRVPGTLISAPGHLWKVQRKSMSSSLGPSILGSFIPIFNNKSAILADLLGQHVGKPERDYSRDISKCFLDQIYETAFGCDFGMQISPDGDKTVDMMNDYMKIISVRLFSVWLYPELIYRMTNAYKIEQELLRAHHDITANILSRIKLNEQGNNEACKSTKTDNFIQCLMKYMQTVDQPTQNELFSHIDMALFAGNDTTAKSLSYILLLIAIYPEVQERCYQEIIGVCPDEDQFVSADDAVNMKYLDMVCKETMRLFPVVPIMGRVTNGEVKLNDHHTIPANCNIILGVYQIHRDPDIWGPNAEQFDPDNFLPEKAAQRHPYAYLPFSAGPRNCMGLRYARISMKITAAHILRKYRLKTSLTFEQLKISYGVMLNIENGCLLQLERR
ncbi:cytochrome P450 4C1-like [Armigeres subalbatus]|uniref:cytochrome P450 4C1-like n=1 Tax=Armigeres subalbatus TaxID=124917 RepID=UPI002ED63D2E